MTLKTQKRIAWIDIAKGITIFLVVFGHTLRGGIGQRIVYSFHVSTFFLLAGMTCNTDNLKSRIKNDFQRILIPYYSFGVLSVLIFAFLGTFAASQLQLDVNVSLDRNFLELLYACPRGGRLKFNMPLWFLPCLFVTKMLYYALYKLCRKKHFFVLIGSLVIAAVGFFYTNQSAPDLPFNLPVSLKMLLFFSLGKWISLWLPEFKGYNCPNYRVLILGVGMLIVTAVVAYFSPRVDYANDHFPNILVFLVTSLLGCFGISFVAMGLKNCAILEYLGKNSLAILVMHKFPVLLFQTVGPLKVPLTQYNSIACIFSSIIVSSVAIMLCLSVEWVILRFFPYLLGDFSKLPRFK